MRMRRYRPPAHEYSGVFQNEMRSFLELGQAKGCQYLQHPTVFKSLDMFLIKAGHSKKELSPNIVDKWQSSLLMNNNTKSGYVNILKQFSLYLQTLGYPAYIPEPIGRIRNRIPHVFTDEELVRLFNVSDSIPRRTEISNAYISIPVLFRMLYGCGLRIGEALGLQINDIDFDTGVLYLKNTKGNKDRIVPMDISLTEICRKYYKIFHSSSNSGDFFFHNRLGNQYHHSWAHRWMLVILEGANIDRDVCPATRRGISLHSFRHTFTVDSLRKQHYDGVDRFYTAPILSTYLGHENIYGTEKYLQITTDIFAEITDKADSYSACIFPEQLL